MRLLGPLRVLGGVVQFFLGLLHFRDGLLNGLGYVLRHLFQQVTGVLGVELEAGLLGRHIASVAGRLVNGRGPLVLHRRHLSFLRQLLLLFLRLVDEGASLFQRLQRVADRAEGMGQLEQPVGGLLLVGGGGVRLVLLQVPGGQRLDLDDHLALFGRLAGGEPGLVFRRKERRQLV